RFLLELAQMTRRLRSVRESLPLFSDYARILSPKHYPPIRAVRILDFSPHFHLHFVNEILRVSNLILDIPGGAKQRAKLAGSPPNERGLILSFKLMPGNARSLQPRHHVGAIGCGSGSQRSLLNPNNRQPIPAGNRNCAFPSNAFR